VRTLANPIPPRGAPAITGTEATAAQRNRGSAPSRDATPATAPHSPEPSSLADATVRGQREVIALRDGRRSEFVVPPAVDDGVAGSDAGSARTGAPAAGSSAPDDADRRERGQLGLDRAAVEPAAALEKVRQRERARVEALKAKAARYGAAKPSMVLSSPCFMALRRPLVLLTQQQTGVAQAVLPCLPEPLHRMQHVCRAIMHGQCESDLNQERTL
jgi:hypothetical protein